MSEMLFAAARSGDLDAVRTALAGSADLHAVEAETGDTVLHVAARSGHLDLVEALLTAGARVNAQNGLGWTEIGRAHV